MLPKTVLQVALLYLNIELYSAYTLNSDKLILSKNLSSKALMIRSLARPPEASYLGEKRMYRSPGARWLKAEDSVVGGYNDIFEPHVYSEHRDKRSVKEKGLVEPYKSGTLKASTTEDGPDDAKTKAIKQRSLFADLIDIPRSKDITIVKPSQIELFGVIPQVRYITNLENNVTNKPKAAIINGNNKTKGMKEDRGLQENRKAVVSPAKEIVKSEVTSMAKQQGVKETVHEESVIPLVSSPLDTDAELRVMPGRSHKILPLRDTNKYSNTNLTDVSNGIKLTDNVLVKILTILLATFKKIIMQHQQMIKIHRDVIAVNKDLMSNRIEMIGRLKEFETRHRFLMIQGSQLTGLQYKLAAKQEMFLNKEKELFKKHKEFEKLKSKFIEQQHKFIKLKKILANITNQTHSNNETTLKPADTNEKIARISKIISKGNKILDIKLTNLRYINNTEAIKKSHITTEKSYSELEPINNTQFSAFRVDEEILIEKEFKNIDELVHKFYFNNTIIENLIKNLTTPCNCNKTAMDWKVSKPGVNNPEDSNTQEKIMATLLLPKQESTERNLKIRTPTEHLIEPKTSQLLTRSLASIIESTLRNHEKIVLDSVLRRNKRRAKELKFISPPDDSAAVGEISSIKKTNFILYSNTDKGEIASESENISSDIISDNTKNKTGAFIENSHVDVGKLGESNFIKGTGSSPVGSTINLKDFDLIELGHPRKKSKKYKKHANKIISMRFQNDNSADLKTKNNITSKEETMHRTIEFRDAESEYMPAMSTKKITSDEYKDDVSISQIRKREVYTNKTESKIRSESEKYADDLSPAQTVNSDSDKRSESTTTKESIDSDLLVQKWKESKDITGPVIQKIERQPEIDPDEMQKKQENAFVKMVKKFFKKLKRKFQIENVKNN